MITNIVWDCNGIFLHAPQSFVERFTQTFGITREEMLPVHLEIMNNVRRPEAPNLYSLWKPYLNAWGIALSENELYQFWFDPEQEVPEMRTLLIELREHGVKSFILSNNFRERYEYKKAFFDDLDALVDGAYYSWHTGFVKPHHDAFKYILAINNLEPATCIFFDDSPVNVASAEELGIRSFLFENTQQVRMVLQEQQVLT